MTLSNHTDMALRYPQSPAGKSPSNRFAAAHADDTMDVDMQTKGAKAVFLNRAYVEGDDHAAGPHLAASTPTMRRNSNTATAFADANMCSPSGRRNMMDLDSRSQSTWAASSSSAASSNTGTSRRLQEQTSASHGQNHGFGLFGSKKHSTAANNTHVGSDEVIEFNGGAEDEVMNNTYGRQSPNGFDGTSSLRSTSSMQSGGTGAANGRRSPKSLAVSTWEAEVAALLEDGSREEAVSRPAPSTGLVQCTVRVVKGMFGKVSKICLYLDNGEAFLLSARKRKKSKASNYIVSLDEEDLSKDGPNCSAKFRANFVGTEYVLSSRSPASRGEYTRDDVAVFFKQSMLNSTPGPRVMTVATPLPEANWCPVEKDGSDTLAACLEKARLRELGPALERKLCMLGNRPPEWDEKVKAHTLDFRGRVKMSSVKNFQLVAWDHNSDAKGSDLVLQFGKVEDNAQATTYALDFQYPLSIKKAFSIALASLDTKLAYAL